MVDLSSFEQRRMKQPFFSVVIPTKGRSAIVGGAIESVFRQTFPDFELLVVDNDDTAATRGVVAQHRDDRLRHVRTGGLSMPDNWEAACAAAGGEFVLIVEDKQALRSRALERIYAEIQKHKPECLRWMVDVVDDLGRITFVEQESGNDNARSIASDECIRHFVDGTPSDAWRYLPIGHLSAYSRTLLDRIKARPPGRVCPPVAPDYCLAFLALAHTDSILHLESALVAHTRKHSNGRSFTLKTALATQFIKELGGDERICYNRVPIQARLNPNLLWNDYLAIRDTVGGRLKSFPFNVANYFAQCHEAIGGNETAGIEMASERKAWQSAFDQRSPAERHAILATIEEREGPAARRQKKAAWKRLRRRTGLQALEDSWRAVSRRLTGRRFAGKFRNAIEYVRWMDERENPAAPARPSI
jgi:hypothetical protein